MPRISPSFRASLYRWVGILALATAALPVCVLLQRVLNQVKVYDECTKVYAEFGILVPLAATFVATALLIVPIVTLNGFRRSHLRNTLKYPPCWCAAIIAFLVWSLIHPSRNVTSVGVDSTMGAKVLASVSWFLSAIVADSLWSWFVDGRGGSPSELTEDNRAKEDAYDWITHERPINHPESDRYRFLPVAKHLGSALLFRRTRRIAIRGEYGSGKSSLMQLIRHQMDEEHRENILCGTIHRIPSLLIHVRIAGWGMSGDNVAPTILRRVIREVGKHADCIAAVGLPDAYQSAVTGLTPGWLHIAQLASPSSDASDQLERLQPCLKALDAQIIIYVEDVERNTELSVSTIRAGATDANGTISHQLSGQLSQTGKHSRFSSLSSFIDVIKDVECISIVVGIGEQLHA